MCTKVKELTRLIRLLLILCFILFSYFVFSIKNTSDYEISIYSSINYWFWLIFLFCILCSASIIIYSSICNESEDKNWKIALLLLLLMYSSIILLPLIKGYYMYGRADVLTHIGHIMDIILNNKVGSDNIYPASHLLIVIFTLLSNANINVSIMVIILLFSLLFIFYIWLLSKQIFVKAMYFKITILFSSIFILSTYHTNLYPQGFSILMLPFIFYLFFNKKTNSLGIRLLFLVYIMFYSFFHPLTALILIFTMLSIDLLELIYNYVYESRLHIKYSFNKTLITFIVFILWMFEHSSFWNNRLLEMYNWFSGQVKTFSNIQQSIDTLNLANELGYNTTEILLRMFLGQIIFLFISLLSIIIIIKSIKKDVKLKSLYLLSGFFVFPALFQLIKITGFDILNFNLTRLIQVILVITPIYMGFFFGRLIEMNSKQVSKLITAFLILVIFMTCACIGIFNVHNSPYIVLPNDQVTKSEIIGITWFIQNQYSNKSIMELGPDSQRLVDSIYGVDKGQSLRISHSKQPLPYHFGYDKCSYIGQSINVDTCLLISKKGRLLYDYVFTNYVRFSDQDFLQLESDPSVLKVYENGNIELYNINPMTLKGVLP